MAGAFITHQDILRQELEIPENMDIITGIEPGYPNTDPIVSNYRNPRRPVQEVVGYKS